MEQVKLMNIQSLKKNGYKTMKKKGFALNNTMKSVSHFPLNVFDHLLEKAKSSSTYMWAFVVSVGFGRLLAVMCTVGKF